LLAALAESVGESLARSDIRQCPLTCSYAGFRHARLPRASLEWFGHGKTKLKRFEPDWLRVLCRPKMTLQSLRSR
jgi:hypothetical protein